MEWFEKEDFWINFAPIMFDENRWKEAPTVASYIKKIANLSDGDKVLDAGCGLGRISVELASLNLDVLGVDIINAELEAAKDLAEAEGVDLKLLNKDLRNFNLKNHFECAINLYTSFGYCDKKEDDLLILKNICESVKNGGTFIMECTSLESAIINFTKGEEFQRAGMKVQTHFSVEGEWEGLRSNWKLTDENNKTIEHEFVQRLYPASFLKSKILEFGFKKVNIYSDFDYSPYNENSRTMILIAKK